MWKAMNISPKLYEDLNKAWKSTCRIVLGDEVGELKDYEYWLKEHVPQVDKRKSAASGKEIAVATNDYCTGARFVAQEESQERRVEALTINEIKDIDSVARAISEKWEYIGNKVLGNSSHVESSDTIADSQYVYDATNISNILFFFREKFYSDSITND